MKNTLSALVNVLQLDSLWFLSFLFFFSFFLPFLYYGRFRDNNKTKLSEISHFMSDFGRACVGGRKRPHVSFRYPDLERNFNQMALETLEL